MLIVLSLYIIGVWLVFTKFKVAFGWMSGSIAVLLGLAIAGVFLALFNYLTPSGRITVVSAVIEITPSVSGEVIEIPVRANEPVKTGSVLFRIDPAPFQYKVAQLEAGLVSAEMQAKILVANFDQATANVKGLQAQVDFHTKRLADIDTLTKSGVATPFREQDIRNQLDVAVFQLQAAEQAERSAKLSLDSQISGTNTSVIQAKAQLDQARWELSQTVVRAAANGIPTALALTVGDRALQARSAMSFVVTDDVKIVGMFGQNGFRTIIPGAQVRMVFDNDPGRVHEAQITEIPAGIGQGQIAVSGTLARTNAIGGATTFPAVISIPTNVDKTKFKLGMSGNATVFAENAGVIGLLAKILVWISAYTAYL